MIKKSEVTSRKKIEVFFATKLKFEAEIHEMFCLDLLLSGLMLIYKIYLYL